MREFTFDDLRCRHFTGRSYIKSGEGRNRVYGYRTGIQCDLGDVEQSEWFRMVRELIEPRLGPMYVTPGNIDEQIKNLSFLIAEGINLAFQS